MGGIVIVDYGMGNLGSVGNALAYLGGRYCVSGDIDALSRADGYILPGVGGFPAAMANLKARDLIDVLQDRVQKKKKPFLGICLGMQLLAEDSVEQGFTEGLGWIEGHVLALESDHLRVPHVGWNGVEPRKDSLLYRGIDEGAHFFFDHSYHLCCDKGLISATFTYGDSLAASLEKENILATQFHPEKSQRSGLKLLRNFLNLVETTRC